ncbi:MAG: AAA family ATPase, partial [Deltaproteobacteria bacterium]|nr:AAA family ATPase [Deltaproteobacteria bacterium]
YVGYEEGGQLTEAVRRRPYSVVLFDEIEKAHPDVFNVLLQILDDGRLTDGLGRTVDFRNTLIVMTSNIGSQFIYDAVKDGTWTAGRREGLREEIFSQLKQAFKPEFLNRVDETIIFNSLDKEDIKRIIAIQMKRILKRLEGKKIVIELDDKARDFLADEGFNPVYGARPLKRAIERHLIDNLAEKILKGEIRDGAGVVVSSGKGGLTFRSLESSAV